MGASAVAICCSGCLMNEFNGGHYNSYYQGGGSAYDAGDFVTAKKRFGRAYWYAQSGLGPKAEAAALYNYALSVGHLGDFEQAEDCLKRTMKLDEKSEGKDSLSASMRLFELARLYDAWGKDTQATNAYTRAITLAEKYGARGDDPIGFASVLDDYGTLLKKLGLHGEAALQKEMAQKLRDAHPGVTAKVRIRYYPTRSTAP